MDAFAGLSIDGGMPSPVQHRVPMELVQCPIEEYEPEVNGRQPCVLVDSLRNVVVDDRVDVSFFVPYDTWSQAIHKQFMKKGSCFTTCEGEAIPNGLTLTQDCEVRFKVKKELRSMGLHFSLRPAVKMELAEFEDKVRGMLKIPCLLKASAAQLKSHGRCMP